MVLSGLSRVLHLDLAFVPICINVRPIDPFPSFAQKPYQNQAPLRLLRQKRLAQVVLLWIGGLPDNFLVRLEQCGFRPKTNLSTPTVTLLRFRRWASSALTSTVSQPSVER
jgi:hypothetical protein